MQDLVWRLARQGRGGFRDSLKDALRRGAPPSGRLGNEGNESKPLSRAVPCRVHVHTLALLISFSGRARFERSLENKVKTVWGRNSKVKGSWRTVLPGRDENVSRSAPVGIELLWAGLEKAGFL